MDIPNAGQLNDDFEPSPEKPAFLKILCVLSMVGCGLMILIFSFGALTLLIGADTIDKMWEGITKSQPQFDQFDRFEFFQKFGMACVFNLVGNVVSLVGVIMMWRLNKIGFFIYAVAELGINFFSLDLNGGGENTSHAGLVFMLLIDLVFVLLYAVNLKHMNKGKTGDDLNSTNF